MGSTHKAVQLGAAKTTAKHVSIVGDDVVLNMGTGNKGIRIPVSMYQIWVFNKDESPLVLWQGELQWPCFIQFKGDKKPDGTRGMFIANGADDDEGNKWQLMISLFTKLSHEPLFRHLCKGKYDDEQIQEWIDNAQPDKSGLPV